MKFLVTADNNGAIGRGAQPLVTIPAMQQSFLKETQGKVVVMGRKTLEGLPGGQPLGNRINVVLSENPAYKIKGAVVCHNIDEALEYLKQFSSEDIYVIGGESIFRQFLRISFVIKFFAEKQFREPILFFFGHIDYEYDADVKFPVNLWKSQEWEMVEEGEEQTYFSLCYAPEIFVRKQI